MNSLNHINSSSSSQYCSSFVKDNLLLKPEPKIMQLHSKSCSEETQSVWVCLNTDTLFFFYNILLVKKKIKHFKRWMSWIFYFSSRWLFVNVGVLHHQLVFVTKHTTIWFPSRILKYQIKLCSVNKFCLCIKRCLFPFVRCPSFKITEWLKSRSGRGFKKFI